MARRRRPIQRLKQCLRLAGPARLAGTNCCRRYNCHGTSSAYDTQSAQGDYSPYGVSGRYLADLFISWINTNGDLCQAVFGDLLSLLIRDELIVAYLLGFPHSEVYRRRILRDDMTFKHPSDAPVTLQLPPALRITWIPAFDADRPTAQAWSCVGPTRGLATACLRSCRLNPVHNRLKNLFHAVFYGPLSRLNPEPRIVRRLIR